MSVPPRDVSEYCDWWPISEPRPCFARAVYVIVRPGGEIVRLSCPAHRQVLADRTRGPYLVLDCATWLEQYGDHHPKPEVAQRTTR